MSDTLVCSDTIADGGGGRGVRCELNLLKEKLMENYQTHARLWRPLFTAKQTEHSLSEIEYSPEVTMTMFINLPIQYNDVRFGSKVGLLSSKWINARNLTIIVNTFCQIWIQSRSDWHQ